MSAFEFQPFEKIARLKRETVITEKLDGTNAQVAIFDLNSEEELEAAIKDDYCIAIFTSHETGGVPQAMYAGSRKRWIAPEGHVSVDGKFIKGTDNFGFARWVWQNSSELHALGVGRHYGEWYGKGIQRGYGLDEKRFALFNTARWGEHNPNTPACCEVVPVISCGSEQYSPDQCMRDLAQYGSFAVEGFRDPEGIVVYHTASRTLYKQTFGTDGGKWREQS